MLTKYFSSNPRVRLLPWPHPQSMDSGSAFSKRREFKAEECFGRSSDMSIDQKSPGNSGRTTPEIQIQKNIFLDFLEGPDSKAHQIVSSAICLCIIYCVLYTLFGEEVTPGGQLFYLLFLYAASYTAGYFVSFLHLPPLLGMLVVGIVQRNLGFFHASGVYKEIIISSREIALTIILIKAGLGLDPAALMKLKFVVTRLALIPCATESIGAAIASHYLLDFPWSWGFLLGFTLSAVSPAVVVPTLLKLDAEGYGTNKGISTLIIAASSIDDIFSISAFGVTLGVIFGGKDITKTIVQGPIEIVLGLIVGIAWGLLSSVSPHPHDRYVVLKRTIFISGGGIIAVLGSEIIGFPGIGPLACISSAFVANLYWKKNGSSDSATAVSKIISVSWTCLEPLLFGLIGTEIDFQVINVSLVGISFCVLVFGLSLRFISCCVAIIGANLNFKETFFVNMAWFPKATVQAALAPIALDTVRKAHFPEDSPLFIYSSEILTISVLSILLTAPLGSVCINSSGPKLLAKEGIDEQAESREIC